ncbi:hypothetical protein EXU34_12770 [Alteromonas sp. ZYF713]|nr:hypothetical protein [Alteromonas sp. ZYF713]
MQKEQRAISDNGRGIGLMVKSDFRLCKKPLCACFAVADSLCRIGRATLVSPLRVDDIKSVFNYPGNRVAVAGTDIKG